MSISSSLLPASMPLPVVLVLFLVCEVIIPLLLGCEYPWWLVMRSIFMDPFGHLCFFFEEGLFSSSPHLLRACLKVSREALFSPQPNEEWSISFGEGFSEGVHSFGRDTWWAGREAIDSQVSPATGGVTDFTARFYPHILSLCFDGVGGFFPCQGYHCLIYIWY